MAPILRQRRSGCVVCPWASALTRIDPSMLSETDPPTKSAMLESDHFCSCDGNLSLTLVGSRLGSAFEAVPSMWAALGRIRGRWRAPTSEVPGQRGLGCALRSHNRRKVVSCDCYLCVRRRLRLPPGVAIPYP